MGLEAATEFYRCQVGGGTVINYSYTDKPWRLLMKDMYYFFAYSWALPWILWPIYPYGAGDLDELYPSASNLFCIFIHIVLVILQLGAILALPAALFFPLWMGLTAAGGFLTLNWLLCKLLNGKGIIYHSEEKYAKAKPEHAHEQWIFCNGVAVGSNWMQNNLNRLALTFGRPILGVHNRTTGILFDVLECLVQRNLSLATNDIRACFKELKKVLYDPSKSKVILVLHSQGGIEGGLALDWLLQEMPQDLLAKLEVYTFGNAANHFNNPHRHARSESLTASRSLAAMTTFMTELSYGTSASSLVDTKSSQDSTKETRGLSRDESTLSSYSSVAAMDKAISHIEHYAHTTDFVAIWGVLHFATNQMGSPELPRFIGRLFNHSSTSGGHQFNQHYLNNMFPLARDPKSGEFIGADEHNSFMEEVVKLGSECEAMDNTREAFDVSWGGAEGFGTGEISTPVEVHGVTSKHGEHAGVQVKYLSRLWAYRNGQSPTETPPLLSTEGGVVRMATM